MMRNTYQTGKRHTQSQEATHDAKVGIIWLFNPLVASEKRKATEHK